MARSRNLEQILAEAAERPAVRELLLGDREAAARELELSDSERQMLMAVPDGMLESVLDHLARYGAAGPSQATVATGARPDPPPATQGIRPDVVSMGVRPEPGPIKGIRPGRVLLTAAAAATVGAGVAAFSISAGVRPDVPPPPVTEPARTEDDRKDAGRPDAGPAKSPEKK